MYAVSSDTQFTAVYDFCDIDKFRHYVFPVKIMDQVQINALFMSYNVDYNAMIYSA